MPVAPFRPDVRENIRRSENDIQRMSSDMKETVLLTREVIQASRARMHEADRLLKQR
jgi:hypothetical protein